MGGSPAISPPAKQAFAAVSPEARTTTARLARAGRRRDRVAENDGAGAIRELDQSRCRPQADHAQNYWWFRGTQRLLAPDIRWRARAPSSSANATCRTPPPCARAATELFGMIRDAAERGQSLKAPPKTDPIVAGWLALGPVAVELARNPMRAGAALANWKRPYPAASGQRQRAHARADSDRRRHRVSRPDRSAAAAVRAAPRRWASPCATDSSPPISNRIPPPAALEIYDVAAESVAGAYRHAVDGRRGVRGRPAHQGRRGRRGAVERRQVHRCSRSNFLADSVNAAHNFYQFALLPEDEARIVARRLVADGKLEGVAIVADGEWGNSGAGRLRRGVVAARRRRARQPALRILARRLLRRHQAVLQVHAVKGEPSTHRTDAAFVFVAGSPGVARLIVPQLKFHFAGDVPVYSTSDSFEPDPSANSDLDGMLFPGHAMDGLQRSRDRSDPRQRARGVARANRAPRPPVCFRFRCLSSGAGAALQVLGRGQRDLGGDRQAAPRRHNRIRRDLDWAQIKNGVPVEL